MTNAVSRIFLIAITLTGLAHAARAQQTPPVLSTTPEPPPGVVAAPAQMSGLPLQVGDLPPGIVVVRVIRRTFAENVDGQTVTLHDPVSGEVLEAITDADGRAQFTGMRVGATVQARTTVDDEPLASGLFPLPAQGGVRLILVAGVGAVVPQDAVPAAATPAQAAGESLPDEAGPQGLGASAMASIVLAGTALAMGIGLFRHRLSHEGSIDHGSAEWQDEATALVTIGPAERRSAAFEELVRLEKDHRVGRIPTSAYAGRREALVTELAQIT